MPDETSKPVIWIIDIQHWPRALLRAELIERGFEAVGYINPLHALAAYYHPLIEKPDMIVLELCDLILKRQELEALTLIGVPIIAIGGAVELNQKLIHEFTWAVLIQRPFTVGTVADTVEELIREQFQKKRRQEP
jgi:hypothetical protein